MACVKYLLLMAMKFLAFQVLCPTQLGVKCLKMIQKILTTLSKGW